MPRQRAVPADMSTYGLAALILLLARPGTATCGELIIPEFSAENERITKVIGSLARAFKTRICVEEAEGEVPEVEGDRVRRLRLRTLTLVVKNATVREMLDRIAEVDPAYAWSYDERTRTYNIYPKENAPLSWEINVPSMHDRTVDEVVKTVAPDFSKHGVGWYLHSGNASWLETRISVSMGRTTARQMLNAVCRELGSVHWEFRWGPSQRSPRWRGYIYFYWYFGSRPSEPPVYREVPKQAGGSPEMPTGTSPGESARPPVPELASEPPPKVAAAPGLPRAGSEDGVRLPFPVLAPYPGEQARSGPAAWPILAVAFAGGLVSGAAAAWCLLRRRPARRDI